MGECCSIQNKKEKTKYHNLMNPLKNERIITNNDDNLYNLNNDEKKKQIFLNKEKEKGQIKRRALLRFTNNNNTYMISILQCLTYTKKLTIYFLNKYNVYNNNNKISNEYYNLLISLWKDKEISCPYPPNDLTLFINNKNSIFNNSELNDGKCLLNFLFENIHNELNVIKNNKDNNNQYEYSFNKLNKEKCFQNFYNNFKKNNNSIISHLFYGIKEIKFKCKKCEEINYKYEFFNFLQFPLKEIASNFGINPNTSIEDGSSLKNIISKIDLYDCFNYNNQEQSLTSKDYKCININCIDNEYFELSTTLFSNPIYLIIFLNNENEDKLKYNVNYPEELYLDKYLICKKYTNIFELYGVISKNENNNYYSYCRNLVDDNIWFKYENDKVNQCQGNEYLSVLPYCLFYKVK